MEDVFPASGGVDGILQGGIGIFLNFHLCKSSPDDPCQFRKHLRLCDLVPLKPLPEAHVYL